MPHASGKSDIPSGKCPFEFDVKKIKFDNEFIGWEYTSAKFNMKNVSSTRFAWKLKCSSNYHFEVTRPSGFLAPGESVEHVVYHIPGILIPKDGSHHFSIYWVKAENDELFSRKFWSEKLPEGCVRLKVDFSPPKKLPHRKAEADKKFAREEYEYTKQLLQMKHDFYDKHTEYPKPKVIK